MHLQCVADTFVYQKSNISGHFCCVDIILRIKQDETCKGNFGPILECKIFSLWNFYIYSESHFDDSDQNMFQYIVNRLDKYDWSNCKWYFFNSCVSKIRLIFFYNCLDWAVYFSKRLLREHCLGKCVCITP